MAFIEGIADLVKNRLQLTILSVTEIDTYWIKYVAEYPGVTEQTDGTAIDWQARLRQLVLHPRSQRGSICWTMIAIIKSYRRPAVIANQPEPAGQVWQLVDIQQQ